KDVLVLVGGSWTTCTPDEAADPTLRCTVTVWTWCLTRGLRSRLAFAAGVAPRVSEIATTPANKANARPAAIVIADLFVMALPPIDRCLGITVSRRLPGVGEGRVKERENLGSRPAFGSRGHRRGHPTRRRSRSGSGDRACLGRDPEVLVHPGGVVPVQVAHDRVVALGHVDREHLRGA